MSLPPLVLRDEAGAVDSVLVARWAASGPDPGATLRRFPAFELGENHCTLGYRSDADGGGFLLARSDVRFDVDRNGHEVLYPHHDTDLEGITDLVSRRIRWAIRAAGILPRLHVHPWSQRVPQELRVLVADHLGDDPDLEALVRAVDDAMRTIREHARREDFSEVAARFAPAAKVLLRQANVRQLVRDDGTEGEAEMVRIDREYQSFCPARGVDPPGHVCTLEVGPRYAPEQRTWDKWYSWESASFREIWALLWATPEKRGPSGYGKEYRIVRRSALPEWLPTLFEPGEIPLDEEEVRLFEMLGEPLPLALPGSQLVRWAERRVAELGPESEGRIG